MIPKKPAPDLILGGNRFSEKIMPHQQISDESDSTQLNQTVAEDAAGFMGCEGELTAEAQIGSTWRV
jgi:hypothetical protein